jgi:hypothetical protein
MRILKVASIDILWVKMPEYAEVMFAPEIDGRLWGCAYKRGEFYNLGFDD